jgi:hypothetical protein
VVKKTELAVIKIMPDSDDGYPAFLVTIQKANVIQNLYIGLGTDVMIFFKISQKNGAFGSN